MAAVEQGMAAPDFEAPDQEGRRHRLSEKRGHWLVLYFYPKDRTFGCTREACSFRDDHDAFRQDGVVVWGVSGDTVASHADFAARQGLPFTLLADPRGSILRAYGVRAWYGAAKRITFVIDPQGTVAKVFHHVRPIGHAGEVLAEIRRLRQETDIKV